MKRNQIIMKTITNIMTINFNILHALMKDRILGDTQSSLTITIYRTWSRNDHTKVMKKANKPNDFSDNLMKSSILGFSRGQRNGRLFLTFPRNRANTQCDKKISNRTSSVITRSLIESEKPRKEKPEVLESNMPWSGLFIR